MCYTKETVVRIGTGILVNKMGQVWEKKNHEDRQSAEESGNARILLWMQKFKYCWGAREGCKVHTNLVIRGCLLCLHANETSFV